MNDLTLKQAPVLLWLLNFGIIREGFNKKKKVWNFHKIEKSGTWGGTPKIRVRYPYIYRYP